MAGAEGLLLGVEFSDGRKAANAGAWTGRDVAGGGGVVLNENGGSGGGRTYEQSFWLTPLPPAGPLLVVCVCVGLGIDETRTVLDGGVIAEAATRVVELWPWQPWEGEPAPPEPQLPPGWFSDVLRAQLGDDEQL
jgi:hypothetical protein